MTEKEIITLWTEALYQIDKAKELLEKDRIVLAYERICNAKRILEDKNAK